MNPTHASKRYCYTTMPSPIGPLTLVGSDEGLAAVLWEGERPNRVHAAPHVEDAEHPVLVAAERQLTEYFDGTRTTFDLPLDFVGTPFQKSVWAELLAIPFGQTVTYGEIASKLGNVRATRAVGAANGRNPIAIIAACHRVVGANGALTGFAGGLAAKAYLLQLERAVAAPPAQASLFAGRTA